MKFFQCKNVSLLTGAGFTKTFGGYLSREMWARIFNHPAVQRNQNVRNCLLNQLNFEHAYAAVMESGNYAVIEKQAFTEALRNVFSDLHKNLFESTNSKTEGIWNVFDCFIKPFSGNQDRCGLFFTLNQDLCVEGAYRNSEDRNSNINVLGIEPRDRWFKNGMVDVLEEQSILVPDEAAVEAMKTKSNETLDRFFYLKLHGSYGWKKGNGSDAMVIGDSKSKAISEEPLFRWYEEVFRQTLLETGQKLVVIGYGFQDSHINRSIAEGVRQSALRLHVVNPTDPEKFRSDLLALPPDPEFSDGNVGSIIWDGLGGYHQGIVTDFYDHVDLTYEGKRFLENLNL